MSGHTPVAMSWSTARSSSTPTPWRSMIDRLRSISPWVWLGSGERLRGAVDGQRPQPVEAPLIGAGAG